MEDRAKKALNSWRDLNELLPHLTESELEDMLNHELLNEKRKTFIERIHQRVNTLRVSRERDVLMEKFK